MSESKTITVKVKPDNSSEELQKILKQFKMETEFSQDTFTIPFDNHVIIPNGSLLFILPDRLDTCICLEPHEFEILNKEG
ncbi:hypothetical protein HYP07_gp099 [Vibrio phage JSF3]|uniref:hypothetical protein n=1 Tax=Vibrio phage JSF3 TaxID=1916111 RepID=UPI000B5FB6D9|nr:hypothetical protein HYP07_gp099 [Vibrio phage JSF3]APD18111.1 hypothetical protein [Vibrio phage JSF3]